MRGNLLHFLLFAYGTFFRERGETEDDTKKVYLAAIGFPHGGGGAGARRVQAWKWENRNNLLVITTAFALANLGLRLSRMESGGKAATMKAKEKKEKKCRK